MKKAIIGYIILIVVIILIWYLATGLRVPKSILPVHATTTVSPRNVSKNTSTTTTKSTIEYFSSCSNLAIFNDSSNSIVSEYCDVSSNTTLGIWVASGSKKSGQVRIKDVSANSIAVNSNFSYSCITFLENYTFVAGNMYNVSLSTGVPGGTCSNQYSILKLNSTTTVPSGFIYPTVYNGNFGTGEYSGWTRTGTGFGSAPLNITKADQEGCYLTSPWTGASANFIATTYNCGISVSPGNLTSSQFYVNEPFLNFKIISPDNAGLYVEVLHNGVPYAIAHYNTYNISNFGSTAPYTFRNASIPLLTIPGQPVSVRVVADTLKHQNFIAVSDFYLSNTPIETPGILLNITLNTST
ncbi:hypothetical protein M1373_03260 [Candidatus Marsarchaeota archaeon]|nr:hypothetical protein [Candidatus Marsarchaeota archaeon]MCL5404765.1 hypothetical protein [Candidatus Marsarchaeota archaeon]